jgi:hypothetical protein
MLHHQPQILSPLPEMNSQSPDPSALRARKMSAGGNRSWSEEEVGATVQFVVAQTNTFAGELPPSDPYAEDALQAYCSAPQEDGACLPPALSSALARQPPSQANLFRLLSNFMQLRRPVPGLRNGSGTRRVLPVVSPQLSHELQW